MRLITEKLNRLDSLDKVKVTLRPEGKLYRSIASDHPDLAENMLKVHFGLRKLVRELETEIEDLREKE